MSIVKKNTGKAEVEKRKLKNAFSHQKMQDDDVIMPPSYKENTGWQSVLNILAGLILGMMVIYFLVMPANTRALNNEHNDEIITYSQKLNAKNQELESLQASYDDLKTSADEMESRLSTIEGDNSQVLAQYQTMIGILQAYRSDDILSVARLYVDLDTSLITDESVLAIADAVKTDMETNGYQLLENLGTQAWNAGRQTEAEEYYQKSLEVQPNNPSATYLLGRLYQSQGNSDLARQYFTRIITEFPESDQASQAENALAQLGPASTAVGAADAQTEAEPQEDGESQAGQEETEAGEAETDGTDETAAGSAQDEAGPSEETQTAGETETAQQE